MQKPTLKLRIFQDIHSKFNKPPWLGFLVLGILIGLEERYINWKTKMTVDKAIKDYHDAIDTDVVTPEVCLLYTSPSPRDGLLSRMPSSA